MNGTQVPTETTLPFPAFTDDDHPPASPGKPHTNSQSREDTRDRADSASSTHKRSLSGSFFSRFLRNSNDSVSNRDRDEPVSPVDPIAPRLAIVQQQGKNRKRKGSLRKTALLLSRKPSGSIKAAKSPLSSPRSPDEAENLFPILPPDSDATPRPSHESPTSPVSPPKWTSIAHKPSLSSVDSAPSLEPTSSAASVTSPTMPTDTSTSDDDSFPRMPLMSIRRPPSSSGDSYFPPQVPAKRRTTRTKSPLATQPHSLSPSPVTSEDEWDYSETAFWGYVILICTWLIFVVVRMFVVTILDKIADIDLCRVWAHVSACGAGVGM
ncbi:MAG: hypothetical protein Q9227_005567 [Pyrenula ochraceoflavens]